MMTLDPIPLFPPRFEDKPSVMVFYPPLTLRRFGNFVHTGGGLQINEDGVISDQDVPQGAVVPSVSNFVSWLLGADVPGLRFHTLVSYQSAIDAAIAARPANRSRAPMGAPVERPNPLHGPSVTPAERAARATLYRVSHQQNAAELTIPKEREFRAIRQGSIWLVVWRDQVVAIGPSKKKARRMAREGNSWLTEFQTAAVVAPQALSDNLSAYLTEAADPNGGFSPIMQTSIPGS